MALTSLAWMWALSAKVATQQLEGDNTGYYHNKLLTGRFFMKRMLPQAGSLADTLMAGGEPHVP